MYYLFPGIVVASLFFFYFPKILAEVYPKEIQIQTAAPQVAVAPYTQDPTKQPYLIENVGPGKKLRFSDGSSFLVSPENQEEVSLWISPFPLHIEQGKDPNFPYLLYNSNTQTSVNVKKEI